MVKFLIAFLTLLGMSSSRWTPQQHKYSVEVSSLIANQIRAKLLSQIPGFVNQDFAKKLQADLNQNDDNKRQLKELSDIDAAQIFSAIKVIDPGCDKNGDSIIKDEQLKCLNYAWKGYLPQ